MFKPRLALFVYVLLIAALSACNLPSSQPTEMPTPDLILTVTAQAALLLQPATVQAQFTSAPGFTPTPQFTSTPTVPMASVSQNTNCRIGPGTQYDLIDSLLVGQTSEVVGRSSGAPNYWIIKRVNGAGTCWLWGEYATVSGNTANLSDYPVPPTPTPSPTPSVTPTATLAPPVPVENVNAAKVCTPLAAPLYQYGGTLTWEDKSNNETGFNIYLNGALFATLGANSVSYPIPPLPFAAGTPMKLGVEAYNSAGKSATRDVTFTCP